MARRREVVRRTAAGTAAIPRRLIDTALLAPEEVHELRAERNAWLDEHGLGGISFREYHELLTASRELYGIEVADPRSMFKDY
ncbi:hypothetical protein GCM10009745_24480 [Kribbella yunnanensis]|uniref:Uncharacterized protein n=1 Tax=Kribbella yunnanensis TaxID=190194 RepID=A0ABP4SZD3_9ACTN